MPKTHYSLAELSQHLGAELRGDPECVVSGIAALDTADAGQISFLHDPKYRKLLPTSKASALIISQKDAPSWDGNALVVTSPSLGYIKVAALFDKMPTPKSGVHPTVIMGENCKVAATASIGPYCVLGDDVQIGDNTIILSGCNIGSQSSVGPNSRLFNNVTLYHGVHLGARVLVHGGVVIGSDGFGMINNNGEWVKIPQIGGVVIGNDVEIGANTTIDRGALGDTIIEEGVKLDNQIHIAHNVQICAHTAIAGCTVIAGSTKIGKHCMIGGACVISGHIEIADGTIITGMAGVPSSIKEPGIYSAGVPIQPHRMWRKNMARLSQLDDIARRLKKLESIGD